MASVTTAQWPLYNGDLAGQRYSPLSEIDRRNVSALQVTCQRTLEKDTSFETGPIVVGDRIFLTTTDATFALDARDCKLLWQADNSTLDGDTNQVNRGVAYLDGRLFRGTTDGYVVSLSAATGLTLWSKKVLDPDKGERFTMSPIAWNHKVFIGDAFSDTGIRGQIMAFEASTGRQLWKTSTIDSDSWPRGAQTGGGGLWTSFSLDRKSAELFVPVSNPAPMLLSAVRPGDNLYTNAVLVLNAGSGHIDWFYQVTPHDEHDWDLAAAPMLFTIGKRREVAAGSKDGFLYVIDRSKHSLVYRTKLTTMSNYNVPLSKRYLHVCPGWAGGVEWNGPAFDRLNKQIIVGAVDWCGRYFQTPNAEYGPNGFLGGGFAPDPASSSRGWITAINAATGQTRWRYHAHAPVVAALTPTAGNVVFAGETDNQLLVFDSISGRRIYHRRMPGAVAGGIVTYSLAGKQYIAVVTGPTLRTTFSAAGDATITILSLRRERGKRLPESAGR